MGKPGCLNPKDHEHDKMARGLAFKIEDEGKSRIGDRAIPKDSKEIEATGAIDALLVSLDLCKIHINDPELRSTLTDLQVRFGTLASILVDYTKDTGTLFTEEDIQKIERKVKEVEPCIPNEFVSFGTMAGWSLNEARVRVREVERRLVPFLNEDTLNRTYYKFINGLSIYMFCLAVENSEPEVRKTGRTDEINAAVGVARRT